MTILHLGVIDIPYSQRPPEGQGKVQNGTQTTGDVATWLENKYGVMEAYFERRGDIIASELENSMAGAIETLAMGGPADVDPYGTVTSFIENDFRAFLDRKEIEQAGIAGVPTGAALRGVNHRFKHPYKRRAPRPSFIDTGLYQSSFTAWID